MPEPRRSSRAPSRKKRLAEPSSDDDDNDAMPPTKTASTKRKSNDDDNNNPSKSAKTTTTTTHDSTTTTKDHDENKALFQKFDSATSKSLATSCPNNNNNSRVSTDAPMDSESLPTTNGKNDEDCVAQRVGNSKSAAATSKDGGSGAELVSDTTEKRSSGIDTMDKGVSVTKNSGGAAKDSDVCVDVDAMSKGGSIAKDSGGIAKDVDADGAGVGKTAGVELVFEASRPQSSKSRGLTARSEWGEEIKNEEAVCLGFVKLSVHGKSFDCLLCDSTVKARHPHSPDSCLGKGGHRCTDEHKKNLQAKSWNMKRAKQCAAQGKLPGKEIKHGTQSTMMGFFRRGSTNATTSSPSTSTTSRSVATSTSATGTNATQSTASLALTGAAAAGECSCCAV